MSANLKQRLATSSLLISCEKAIASGLLPAELGQELARAIDEIWETFGPDLSGHDLPSNVIRIGDHDPEYIRALNAVSQEIGS